MSQDWTIDGPRVLDIGEEGERVRALKVAVVGGRVDVVTHDDSPTARLEVTAIEGLPLQVSWDGSTLKVMHGKDTDKNILEMLRRTIEHLGKNSVVLSLSVPSDTTATVSTVSATSLVSGLHADVKANTVSGSMTLTDLAGDLDLNTVSGDVECTQLEGPLKINSVSGAVTVQGAALPRVKINTVSGDIVLDLTSPTSEISSNSVSGDVTVRAPLTGYDVEAGTASGQVVVDGKKVGRASHGYGPEHGGRLREGDGAMRIKANAVSGSIVVLRAGQGAATAPPQDAPPSAGFPHGSATPNAPTDTTTIPQDATSAMPSEPTGHPQDHPAPEAGPWSDRGHGEARA